MKLFFIKFYDFNKRCCTILLLIFCLLTSLSYAASTSIVKEKVPYFKAGVAGEYIVVKDSIPGVRKIKDVVIYEDPMFYSSFPSVVKRPNGEVLVAFRRAPDRKIFGEKGTSHTDPNSYLVMVRSRDGETWTKEPELIYAHPFGGSQDPCLLQLRDGTLLCASYGWAFVRPDGLPNLKKPVFESGGAIFLGGYLVRSTDGGKKWQAPVYPPNITPEVNYNAYGKPECEIILN